MNRAAPWAVVPRAQMLSPRRSDALVAAGFDPTCFDGWGNDLSRLFDHPLEQVPLLLGYGDKDFLTGVLVDPLLNSRTAPAWRPEEIGRAHV